MDEIAEPLRTDVPSRKLMAAVEAVALGVRSILQDMATEHGVSLLQLQVVQALSDGEPRRMGYIAERLAVTRATASDAVAAAVRKGLIERRGDPRDGRVVMVSISPLGVELARSITRRLGPFFAPDETTGASGQAIALRVLLAEIRRLHLAGVATTIQCCFTCVHHQPGEGESPARCLLLGLDLPDTDLRVDCPEHESIRP